MQALEAVQDLIAVSLCLGIFCVMALQLKAITADILFILILAELFRLLIIDLQEQRVSIGVSVWLPPTFAGVHPEAQVSAKVRHQHQLD